MRRAPDAIDLACEEWARVRRQLLGLRNPTTASEYLGAVRSTLGQRRDLHAGARSEGRVDQHWPEVYLGDGALVNAAFHTMPEELQTILDVHYAIERPRDRRKRADLFGIGRTAYWDRVGRAKSWISGAFAMNEKVSGHKPRKNVA